MSLPKNIGMATIDLEEATQALLARLREAQAQYVGTSLTAPEVVCLLVLIDGLTERITDAISLLMDGPEEPAA